MVDNQVSTTPPEQEGNDGSRAPPSTPGDVSCPTSITSAEELLKQVSAAARVNIIPPTPPVTPMVSYDKVKFNGSLPPAILLPECLAAQTAKETKTLSSTESKQIYDNPIEAIAEEEVSPVVAPTAAAASAPAPFSNLLILPPLQKIETPSLIESIEQGTVIVLPALRPEEPIASLRAALSELKQYASLTQYRLQLETDILLPEETQFTSRGSSGEQAEGLESAHSKLTQNGKHGQKKVTKKLNGTALESGIEEFPHVLYTGVNAEIRKPCLTKNAADEDEKSGIKTSVLLDDYGDLTPVASVLMEQLESPEEQSNAGSKLKRFAGFRIILHRYDSASVRDHISRCKHLLDGNVPSVDRLVEITSNSDDSAAEDRDEEEKSDSAEESDSAPKETEETKSKGENKALKDPRLPRLSEDFDVAVDGNNVVNFYNLACGEDDTLEQLYVSKGEKESIKAKSKKQKRKEASSNAPKPDEGLPNMETYVKTMEELDLQCKTNYQIRFSGFHPPPPSRRLLGDLAYLEVIPPGETTVVIHITACVSGFYLNKTTGNGERNSTQFNPSPSAKPCFHHSLIDCLLTVSDAFRKTWVRFHVCLAV